MPSHLREGSGAGRQRRQCAQRRVHAQAARAAARPPCMLALQYRRAARRRQAGADQLPHERADCACVRSGNAAQHWRRRRCEFQTMRLFRAFTISSLRHSQKHLE